MGLSSNARLLSITARLTSNEYESQQISNSKMRLAAQSQEASQNYLAALSEDELVFMGYTSQGFETTNTLTAALLYEFGDTKNQYGIINTSGQLLVDEADAMNFQNSATLDVFLENVGVEKVWKDKTLQEYYELYTSDEYQGYKTAWEEVCADVADTYFDVTYKPMSAVVGENSDNTTYTTMLTSDEAWEFVYMSSITQLKELANLYNDCVTSYNKATGESISKYELNYTSNKNKTYLNKSVTGITYGGKGNGNLGNFRAGYDTNNGAYQPKVVEKFNNNVNTLKTAENRDAEDVVKAQAAAVEFMRDIYQQILKAEEACNQCATKDIWISNIAKTIAPKNSSSKTVPTFEVTDDTTEPQINGFVQRNKWWGDGDQSYTAFKLNENLSKGDQVAQMQKYIEDFTAEWERQHALQDYDRTAGQGTRDSVRYENYQKYLELEAELSYMLEDYGATIANPSNCYTYSDQSRFKWYTNLWYKMNGESTRKSNEGVNAHNYKVLDRNLLQSKSWLQDALRNGMVTLEIASNMEDITMADLFDVSYIGNYPNELTLKNIKWSSKIYTSCSDITTVQDRTRIARAEAEYERRTQEISAKDQRYQNTLKKLETEHSALQTEYESVQNALEKNIDRSFKTFNG